MAILTKTGMNKILRRIMETGGLTPDMEEDIQRLRDDFDERESILKKYGETYDGEEADEYEYTPKEEEKDAEEWRTILQTIIRNELQTIIREELFTWQF